MKVTHIDHGDWTEERWEPDPPDDPTTGNGKAIGGTPGVTGAGAGADAWPVLDKAAYYGLAGDVVNTIASHTESDPVALLLQFLVSFGNVVGRQPYLSLIHI